MSIPVLRAAFSGIPTGTAVLGTPVWVSVACLFGPNEVVASQSLLQKHGFTIGDRVTLYLNGEQQTVTIVGGPDAPNPQAFSTAVNSRTTPQLVLPALAGVVIAVLAALLPAGSAARQSIATVRRQCR
ncbi:hypothetical protein LN042_33415 [Kitasatospora sp. RB6PN24]|uniref:hypothetical protein n=1 Tax=Kitasatospora humi TaxID=2893891 RepID=UPI001E28E550|nr:hypothetical protein [Kitasatospora humi]MCC9311905.1 hypothetical protein [Kitasatospora humi]